MKRIALSAGVLVLALIGAVLVRAAIEKDDTPIVVVHWSNSHPMRDGLLPAIAEEFNDDDHETSSGQPIEVVLVSCDSATQIDDLTSRLDGAGASDDGCTAKGGGPATDPTIITPQSTDWLVDLNHRVGRQVADSASPHLAETWLGIVTHRDMAECLGWPDEDLGYHTILELAADPEGWGAYDCAELEWGTEPLLAFTNPNTSTSGRNVLVSLYSMAAGRPPAELTIDDVSRPDVVGFVEDFQGLVDHYLPGTIQVNTKIAQGPAFGHFFLMPEDNVVSLSEGNEKVIGVDGSEQIVASVKDLVMIYPSEGSVLNANPAAIVDAPWVDPEAADAAAEWIDYVREDEQQQRFVDAGFRPGTDDGPAVDERQFAEWGLAATEPALQMEPGDLDPAVLAEIVGSWGAVKNPAIVTFVVDVSGSMAGEPLAQVKDGLLRVLEAMDSSGGASDQVGLVTFSDTVREPVIAPGPLDGTDRKIADAVLEMEATGQTALYDAIGRAIELTSAADGVDRAKRAVVVLSDGAATAGRCLDELVAMRARNEAPIASFCGLDGDVATDDRNLRTNSEDVIGESLSIGSDQVQVFFLGFGDADINIGRILAEATGAEYRGSTNEDLATLIENLGGYF